MTATIDPGPDVQPDGPDTLDRLVELVTSSPFLQFVVWIDFARTVDVPAYQIGGKGVGLVRVSGVELTMLVEGGEERVVAAKAFGVRLTRAGDIDGRSRPSRYDLPEAYRPALMQALADHSGRDEENPA